LYLILYYLANIHFIYRNTVFRITLHSL